MTAEVAILNRSAVALAADSALTTNTSVGTRTFNTAEKIFRLSRYHPIGVMVYGNAALLEVPWETILKTYRLERGRRGKRWVQDYAEDLIAYLQDNELLFPVSTQREHFKAFLRRVFEDVVADVSDAIRALLDDGQSLTAGQIGAITEDVVRGSHDEWKAKPLLPANKGRAGKPGDSLIDELIAEVFESLPLTLTSRKMLRAIARMTTQRDYFPDESGIVVSGYGSRDRFPGLVAFTAELMLANRLKYATWEPVQISVEGTGAAICPFAQRDMLDMMIEGVDPFFTSNIADYWTESLSRLPGLVASRLLPHAVPASTERQRSALAEELTEVLNVLLAHASEMRELFSYDVHRSRMLETVALLPKDELATMAETLILVTAFKRRLSVSDVSSVGGNIDVAVISRGDGFIWLRRKHYYSGELNPHRATLYHDEGLSLEEAEPVGT